MINAKNFKDKSMKTRLLLTGLCAGIAFLGACNDSDDDKPGDAVEKAFRQKYPTATRVEWDNHGKFREADFVLNGSDYEAWYNDDAEWLQAEHDVNYTAIPAAVKNVVENSINYPSTTWRPDPEVKLLERRNYPDWYGVELENGKQEVTIWSDAEGFRSLTVTRDLSGNEVPQAIRTTIARQYPQGYYEEVEMLDDNSYWVNLLHGKEVKQVYFTATPTWNYTEWPVPAAELPAAVQETLKGNAYTGYSVKSAAYQEHPDNLSYYAITLENTEHPTSSILVAKIKADGSLVLAD